MTTKTTHNNIPALRFPEFQNNGEWKVKRLGEIVKEVDDKCNISKLDIDTYISTENMLQNFEGVKKASKLPETGSFTCFKKGDILFSNIRPYLKKVWQAEFDGAASNDVIVFRVLNDLDCSFVSQIVKSDDFIAYTMAGAKGVKMPRGDKNMMLDYAVCVPPLAEQQRIATVLSEIDTLLSATNDKLEQLKAYKKGLMQKLFPAKGKKLPELRFKEFEKDEWKMKLLGDCLLQTPDYGLNAPAVPFSNDLPTYLRITDISDEGYFIKEGKVSVNTDLTKENSLQKGNIVFARTGASVGKVYKYREDDGPLVFAGFLIRIKPDGNQLNSDFLFQYLFSSAYKRWVEITSTRSGQPGINSADIESLPIPFPSLPEQHKIADCLTSIDEMINQYSNKVTLLEVYKKGLMQQMFPISK